MKNAEEIADAYLSHFRVKSPEAEWALDAVQDFTLHKRWEEVWQVILAIARRDTELETEALAYVAAGPLEDLVCRAGAEFIERVEHEAKFNHQFGRLLTGVWLYSAQPAVRERVAKFCRAFPNPIDEPYAF
jgi:Family of unknown function (DUF6869)